MALASPQAPIDEYKQVVESFAQAVWETDAQGQVVTDSPSWRAYTGQSLEQWLGEGWIGAVHPDDQAYALHQWQEAVRQQTLINAEFRLRSPDGGWRWTDVWASYILDADGSVSKWVGLNIDIDDKKKAQQALQQYQTRLQNEVTHQTTQLQANQQLQQATLNSTLEMIQVFQAVRDEQGQIVDFVWLMNNQAARQYYGDVIGQRLLEQNPGVVATGIFDTFKEVAQTGMPDQSERHYVHEQFDGWFYQSTVKLNDGVATTTTDITSLKKAQQELQQSKALLQDIIDAPTIGIAVYKALRDEKGQIIDFVHEFINRASLAMLGGENFTGKLFTEHGENATLQLPQLIDVVETGTANSYLREADFRGRRVWFAITNTPLDGDRLVHTWEDVTERKTTEAEILRLKDELAQQATDKYQALFNSIDQGFNLIELIFDDNGHVIDYVQREHNPVFTRITGISDAIGKRMSELVPFVEPEWHRMIEAIYYTGEPIRVDYPVGALGKWFTAYMSRVGGEGSPLIACVYDDITDKKNLEERQVYLLRLSDELRPMTDPVDIQARAAELLGQQLGSDRAYYIEVHPETDEFVVARDWHQPGALSHARRYPLGDWAMPWLIDGKTWVVRDTSTDPAMPDGQRASYLSNDIGAAIVVPLIKQGRLVAIFVTNQRQPRSWSPTEVSLVEETAERTWASVERARAEDALKQEYRRKDEFLAMLGHELRNPLAAMTNTLLVLDLTKGQDESMPYTKGIQILTRHSQHLNRMVDDLLDMSRIRQGIVQLQWEAVNLNQLLQLTVEAAQPLYREENRQLRVSLPDKPLYVRGDEVRLAQVVTNLLTNGAKYTDPGGAVWVSLESAGDQAILRVADNGIGLTSQEQTGIFEVFVQGATSLDRPHGGLGLGLAVVKQLIEGHGGQIQAVSPGPGLGSEFVIRLPILADLADTVPPHQEHPLLPSGRVLVVDDNVDFADMTARLLRSTGFEVYTRYTGAQGLAGAESLQPDALLLDIGMPYLDGYDVCRQIRAQPWGQTMAIVALTGYGLEADRQKTAQACFDGHLLKPVNLGTMAQVVAGAIDRRKSH